MTWSFLYICVIMTRFAIVGTGRISDWILKGAVQDPRFKGVAICSRSIDSAKAFALKHPEVFGDDVLLFDSVEEMAQCPAIDAVYIGTPNSTHHGITMTCLRAGKHVLCEKPLACSLEEAREMADAARSAGKVLMEAMISTLNPNFRAARSRIGDIGPVRHASFTFCQYSSKYEALKEGKVSNSFNQQMGGGALGDIGVYCTFPAVALFGRPLDVKANLITLPTSYGPTDVQGTAELLYPGMTVSLAYSKVVDSKAPTELCGEGGNITLDAIHICRKVEFEPHRTPTSGRGPATSGSVIAEGLPCDEYFYEFEEFISVVEEGRSESDINSLEVSLTNMEVMEKIRTFVR